MGAHARRLIAETSGFSNKLTIADRGSSEWGALLVIVCLPCLLLPRRETKKSHAFVSLSNNNYFVRHVCGYHNAAILGPNSAMTATEAGRQAKGDSRAHRTLSIHRRG